MAGYLGGGGLIFSALAVWAIGEAVVIVLWVMMGHDSSQICEAIGRQKWSRQSPERIAQEPEMAQAQQDGKTLCEYYWSGSVPTVSHVGGLNPEWYVFAGTLQIVAIFVFPGFEKFSDFVEIKLRRLEKEGTHFCFLPSARVMRWMLRSAVISMNIAGWISVASGPTQNLLHHVFAGIFFVVMVIHTWCCMAAEIVVEINQTRKSLIQKKGNVTKIDVFPPLWRKFLRAAPRHQCKTILGLCFGVYAICLVPILACTSLRDLQRVYGPVLEWMIILLIDLSVLVHGFDLQALHDQKDDKREENVGLMSDV